MNEMIRNLFLWNLSGSFILYGMKIIAASDNLTGAVGQSEGLEFINPLFIYKHNKVNWFGALVIALFYSMLCPIATLFYWFYKICTVGRKD